MSTEVSVDSICFLISEERNGFKFGTPDRPSDTALACILPILRETSQKRQYVTFPETDEVVVTDSGRIDRLSLQNKSKENIFIRSGTIFSGKGTQSRALARSTVLYAGQTIDLEVRCVHASHGIRTGSGFEYGGVTPLSVDSAFYDAGYKPRDQRTMWNSVTSTSAEMRSHLMGETPREFVLPPGRDVRYHGMRCTGAVSHSLSREVERTFTAQLGGQPFVSNPMTGLGDEPGSDNLKKNFDEFARNFDSILSKARLHDDQVGLSLITDTGCKTIEVFDLPASWEAIHKDSVKRMATELLRGPDETNVFEYKPERAVAATKKVLALPFKTNVIFEHKPSNGEPHLQIFGLTADRYVGEVVELDQRVIHLVILETT